MDQKVDLLIEQQATRYVALMKSVVDAIVVIDRTGIIQEFNSAAEAMFGYAQGEVLGKNVSLLMPAPYAAEHDHYLDRYIATGEAHVIGIGREVRAQRKDGSVFPVDLSVGEIPEGERPLFVGILRDLTERKEAEEVLRQREEALSQIINNAPVGIVTCDQFGFILEANEKLAVMLGYSKRDLRGRLLSNIVHPHDLGDLRTQVETLFTNKAESFAMELRLCHGSGLNVPCRALAGTVHDAVGRPQHMILQFEDLTEQRAAREEAQEQRERLAHVTRLSTLGEMASGIAHEINQPLAAITTYAQAAKRMLAPDSDQEMEAALDKIAQQAQRAAAVIKRLRRFVQRHESEQELCDSNGLVLDTLQFLQMDAARRDVKVQTDLAQDLPCVLADSVQIQQVILNLVLNAVDATDPDSGEQVVVRTWPAVASNVVFEVVDRGCGISEAHQHNLFTPFFTTKSSGLGIGLSICRSIIQAHGGKLNFYPNPEGGSIFRFTLPAINEM